MPAKPRPEKTSWHKGWLLKCTLLLILIAAFLGGVIGAGWWGLEQLRGSQRYDVAFANIECEPPVGMPRQDFLDEVRYGAPSLPKQLSLLDEELTNKLRAGFAKHAWVEKVEGVEIKRPKQIIVKLTYRTPVLAVKVGSKMRAVDGNGVLLPKNAPTLGLPVYEGDAPPPAKEAGTPWGDPNVEAAARALRMK
jgi:hypothetical protein